MDPILNDLHPELPEEVDVFEGFELDPVDLDAFKPEADGYTLELMDEYMTAMST